MQRSPEINELATALSKFQGEIESVKKDAANPFFKSKYSTLAAGTDATRAGLSKNGLSVIQTPATEFVAKEVAASGVVLKLTTMLLHSSGQFIEETYSMIPADNKPQTIGSCISYMRRYAYFPVLGLASDDDDDGNAASGASAPAPVTTYRKPPATKEAVKDFDKALDVIEKTDNIDKLIEAQQEIPKSTRYTAEQKEQLLHAVQMKLDTLDPTN